eukprot:CAMPEP_0114152372 /NCGR_PEP_ID=MMETSP0043_2-20121206/23766_1 /TAXON_ID=464988 /ORGANISM="Hemiselmis andersenii, Strain CCMP644" /LENGTH=57 /DNA_ID=CAMNT_0001247295 /DNA_START=111 /DNA_END=281 /DNA_ORIENTATION=+
MSASCCRASFAASTAVSASFLSASISPRKATSPDAWSLILLVSSFLKTSLHSTSTGI